MPVQSEMAPAAIEARGLERTFKGGVEAVRGIDLSVAAGEVFGFLGPNGAGKTTTVRMLCTLLPPTAGSARVAGIDVLAQPATVRRRIGVALQEIGLDPLQTGRELLELQCGLYGISGSAARSRAQELLELVGLSEAAGRRTTTSCRSPWTVRTWPPRRQRSWSSRASSGWWSSEMRWRSTSRTALPRWPRSCAGSRAAGSAWAPSRSRAPRWTTSSCVPPAGAWRVSRGSRRDRGAAPRSARRAGGCAPARGHRAHALHPAVLPRRQHRPGLEDVSTHDVLPARPGLRRLSAAGVAAVRRVHRHVGAGSSHRDRARLLRQAARRPDPALVHHLRAPRGRPRTRHRRRRTGARRRFRL